MNLENFTAYKYGEPEFMTKLLAWEQILDSPKIELV